MKAVFGFCLALVVTGCNVLSSVQAPETSMGNTMELPAPAPSSSPGVTASPAPEKGTVSYNTETRKYHEPGCRYYGCANCEGVSRAYAESNGKPCEICH